MFHLDALAMLVTATLALLLGCRLVHPVPLLEKYTISEPIAGGLLVASTLLILKKSMGWGVSFSTFPRDPLMLAFFTIADLNTDLVSLRVGGRVVGVFLTIIVSLLMTQNIIGIGMANLLGFDSLMGLLAGSITLPGGHGTDAARSKLSIERYSFADTAEVVMTCAMFGLMLDGLIGDPVARYLMKHSTIPNGTPDDQEALTAFEESGVGRVITSLALIEAIALIAIRLVAGKTVA